MSDVSFNVFWLLENLWLRYFLVTLLIKNGGYAFLIKLDLKFLCHYGKSYNCFKFETTDLSNI